MKITGYRELTTIQDWGHAIGDVNGSIESGITDVPILILETDEGIEGIGLGPHDGIEQVFPAIEGEDPRAVMALYDRMLGQVFKTGHQGWVFGAIGVLDMALWDLKAKLADEPAWRTVGARDRFVPGYSSCLDGPVPDDDLAPMWQEWADRGFTAVKVKGGADVDHDIARIKIAQDVFSGSKTSHPSIFYDVNESWSPAHAVSHLRHIADAGINLTWIEEPARRWDANGLRFVRDHGGVAVASGENLTGIEQFMPLLTAGALDVVQTGSCWGITHALRTGLLAFSHNLPYSPVGYNANPVACVAAALPNHMTTEIQSLTAPLGISVDQSLESGGIVLGDSAGLGFTIDEKAIEEHRQAAPWRTQAGPHVRPASTGFALPTEK
ncbi:MAG: hypothetical protein LKJ47_09180 [Bifidobacteriaceae bacterium]|jgi:L-alanine-DL-glutamate epimerase-like enolase superfamily enzyme|nr:hypothetical protein [Bifidobacteriaceae bacterium]